MTTNRKSEDTGAELAAAQQRAAQLEERAGESGTPADFKAFRAAKDDCERLALVHRRALALEENAAAAREAERVEGVQAEIAALLAATTKAGRLAALEKPMGAVRSAVDGLLDALAEAVQTQGRSDAQEARAAELAHSIGETLPTSQHDRMGLGISALEVRILELGGDFESPAARLTLASRHGSDQLGAELSGLAGKLIHVCREGTAWLSQARVSQPRATVHVLRSTPMPDDDLAADLPRHVFVEVHGFGGSSAPSEVA